MSIVFKTLCSLSLVAAVVSAQVIHADEKDLAKKKETLGAVLFFDVNLSKNRTQSCATCHNPNHGFVDDRDNALGRAVSLGDDGHSFGDRNTPTAAYAGFIPKFQRNKAGDAYRGGQFFDGRETDLAGQAGGPPINPIEMGMPDKASVVERLKDNAYYQTAFQEIFGKDVFGETDSAYSAMADSIAAFEKTDLFAPFDSKYDRFLRGEAKLTKQESLGESLFFSQQFTNCNGCHQIKAFPGSAKETFTNYEYHNLGVPVNEAVRKTNKADASFTDNGLLDNPTVDDPKQRGKFKVSTLRNVAVTGPYMHNGVFKDLRTTILFYDKFNNSTRKLNPETGKPWREPEVSENIALEDKEFASRALKDSDVDALVAFLKTLTDKRYEHLLEDNNEAKIR